MSLRGNQSTFGGEDWYNIQSTIRSQFEAFYATIEKQGRTVTRLQEQMGFLRAELRDKDAMIDQLARDLVEVNGRLSNTDFTVARLTEDVGKMPSAAKDEVIDALLVHVKREREARETEEAKLRERTEETWLQCKRIDSEIKDGRERDAVIRRQLAELTEWRGLYKDFKRDLEQHSVDPKELNTVLERKVDVEVLENIIDDLKAALAKKVDTITFNVAMDQAGREASYRSENQDLSDSMASARKAMAADSMAALSQQVSMLRSRVRSPGLGVSGRWTSPFSQ
ncbi:chromosome segregation protein [Carpediemonas membranifera]|uniref:Chromosome segregation protein n=1 Tax=Carpediemonas membranifera TaxID=201153 RepID=A0A8J6B0C4_9EUKA|nr:chromosome segregation protein [Carpediemonas membranifera]|eukprot:KAG9396590.1 chromosome segregation protein [Carpediemonas membranifera]